MNQIVINVLQVNTVGIFLMAIILFSIKMNLKSGILADRIFFMLSLAVLMVCLFEILGTSFNTQSFKGAKFLNKLFNSLLFAANPIPAYLWAMYAHSKIYDNEKKLKKSYAFLAIPMIIVILLSFANMFVDIFFVISSENVYSRGDYFILATLMSVFYMVYVGILILVERKNISKKLYIPLLSFMILPVIGLTVQFLFYGLYLLWVSIAISVIIIYNFVQNDNSITDWLTGMYNRKHLDLYLHQQCKKKRDNILVGLMMDVDAFKNINDTYGHLTGDKALKDIAKIIKLALGKKSYVARYAGDEFVAILELSDEKDIDDYINKINKELTTFNTNIRSYYRLSLSIGKAIFKGANNETSEEFLSRMDKEMYNAKLSN